MTALDVVLGVVWLGLVLGGFWKGAVRIVFGLGGAAVGVWLAVAAHLEVSTLIMAWTSMPWLAAVLGWVLPPVLCLALAVVAGWGLDRTLEALHLGWLNRLVGAALAGLVGAVLLGMLVATAAAASPVVRRLCEHALVAPLVTSREPPVEEGQHELEPGVGETEAEPSSGR